MKKGELERSSDTYYHSRRRRRRRRRSRKMPELITDPNENNNLEEGWNHLYDCLKKKMP